MGQGARVGQVEYKRLFSGGLAAVSSTHLTLPTIPLVELFFVAFSSHKKHQTK